MLIPVSFEVKNYMRLAQAGLAFSGPGVYYVTGDTGAGKSTLLRALWWTLTNEAEDLRKLEQVVGKAGTRAECKLVLKDEEGRICSIVRWRERSGASGLEAAWDGEDQTSLRGKTATQANLAESLGLAMDALKYVHYLPQQHHKSGFLYDSDSERKRAISLLRGQEMLEKFPDHLERNVRPGLAKDFDAAQAQVSRLQGQVQANEEQFQRLSAQVAALKQENESRKALQPDSLDVEAVNAEIAKQEGEAQGAKVRYEQATKMVTEYRVEIAKARQEAHAAEQAALAAAREQDKILKQLAIDKAALHESKACPLCQQSLSTPETTAGLRRRINEAIARHGEQAKLEHQRGCVHSNTVDLIGVHQTVVDEQQVIVDRARASLQTVNTRLSELRAQLSRATPVFHDLKPLSASIESIQEKLATLYEELMTAEDARDRAQVELGWCQLWYDAYRHQLKNMAFENLADDLTRAAMAELTTIDSTMQLRFDVAPGRGNTERFAVEIRDWDEDWREALGASGGEKGTVALSIFLALLKTTPSPLGFVIMDEPLEHISESRVLAAQAAIERIARDRVVFFVTHNPALVPRDAKQIAMRMDEGTVKIVEGAA